MDPVIIANIKKKFQLIRQMYKEEVGHKAKDFCWNILPLIGVEKQKKKEERSIANQKFNITDIINKSKRKVNKYKKFDRLSQGLTALGKNKKNIFKNKKLSEIPLNSNCGSPYLSITSGIGEKLDDPYWKNDFKTPVKASLSRQFFLKSTKDATSEPSTSRKNSIKSALQLPFMLKFNDDNKLYAIPSPKKHSCDAGKRSISVGKAKTYRNRSPMDLSLPRDYKVFDVNLSINDSYEAEGIGNKIGIPNLVSQNRTTKNNKTYVNYSKSKEPQRLQNTLSNDVDYLGEDDIRKAEKVLHTRTDNSPVMRVKKKSNSSQR